VAELLALVDGANQGTVRIVARSAHPVQHAARKPVKSSAAQGLVRPAVSVHIAAPTRGREELRFVDVPAKSSANGHRKGESDHFEN
jgi:hypothetical protein